MREPLEEFLEFNFDQAFGESMPKHVERKLRRHPIIGTTPTNGIDPALLAPIRENEREIADHLIRFKFGLGLKFAPGVMARPRLGNRARISGTGAWCVHGSSAEVAIADWLRQKRRGPKAFFKSVMGFVMGLPF